MYSIIIYELSWSCKHSHYLKHLCLSDLAMNDCSHEYLLLFFIFASARVPVNNDFIIYFCCLNRFRNFLSANILSFISSRFSRINLVCNIKINGGCQPPFISKYPFGSYIPVMPISVFHCRHRHTATACGTYKISIPQIQSRMGYTSFIGVKKTRDLPAPGSSHLSFCLCHIAYRHHEAE